jgi:hypothetical protein
MKPKSILYIWNVINMIDKHSLISLTLEDKDIIQVDATVIIGVMILLTLSIGFDSSINAQKNASVTRLMITLAIIAPLLHPQSWQS